jgi:Rnl2 family RNA ligase
MDFHKFSSLENSYRQNLIDKVQYECKDGGLWMATEKLHGANFSFWCDGTEVKFASRSQFVDGTFYNCEAVINKYQYQVMQLWLNESCGDDRTLLIVYGELFGGNIQKEVKYGEKDFRAFDVVVNGTPISKSFAQQACLEVGVPFVPVFHVGTFAECLALPNTFKSTLTPEGYEGENNAEGLVIEPVEPAWFNNGSRIYFKNKTESFTEKKPKEIKVFELSEAESDLMNDILAYNTEQRVSNVISKIGAVTNKDFGKILGLTVQDMFEEFTKETEREPKVEAENNWKQFVKLLQSEVGKTVRSEFLKVIE